MNTDIIKGHWHEIKGKLRQQWGKLTEDDIAKMQGSYEALCGQLQKTYGYQKDQASAEIDSFISKHKYSEKV